MRVTRVLALALAAALFVSVGSALAAPSAATACTVTGFFRDSSNLTAAVIATDNQSVSDVDAKGCDIGVYVGTGVTGVSVTGNVYGAKYFGVAVDGGSATVDGATVYDIGNSPFDGTQHGVGIYYTAGATGSVTNSAVSSYQKGGIVATGAGTAVTITDNTVTGLGKVDFIAQNGIQVSSGAVSDVRGNSIADNFYTGTVGVGPNAGGQNPPGWEYVSGGLLLYEAGSGTKYSLNHFSGNQRNVLMVP